jgi:hypothetical protein
MGPVGLAGNAGRPPGTGSPTPDSSRRATWLIQSTGEEQEFQCLAYA